MNFPYYPINAGVLFPSFGGIVQVWNFVVDVKFADT